MIRAVIADDEAWIRSLMRNMIDWRGLGIQLAGEAENGTMALGECLAKRPDILITDVKMPGLDGLDLIRRLKDSLPELETIVISGYDDFSYAQAALRQAVLDYVLKPINKGQMESSLLRAVEAIDLRRRQDVELRARDEKLRKLEASVGLEGNPVPSPPGMDERIARVCAYLQEHFVENPSLEVAASLGFMNKTYFSEVFKRETGSGYGRYLLELKMRKARAFLERSELRICEIASSLGYPDPAYFDRVFKKRFSQTPEEYRARLREVQRAGTPGLGGSGE